MDEDDVKETAASSAAAPSQKNANKKAKKKAKKERENLQKEQAAEASKVQDTTAINENDRIEEMKKDIMGLTNDHNNDLISKSITTKQISHIVDDDIVVVKDVPSENQSI